MSLVVFAGPTLSAAEIAARIPAVILPPAGQGDLWRAVRRHRPVAIGLIDGVFRTTRAVWHREILWALSEGVHVLGAASMGALRAAELHGYGMRGIGRVFELYRSGFWAGDSEAPFEDDDEVAVEHAPAELGHLPLSTAMVDLRDTLLAAQMVGALEQAARLRLTAQVKAVHYPRRSLALLEREAGMDFSPHHIPRKRLDAFAMLDALEALADAAPFVPDFRFQRTLIWERFVADAERAEIEAEAQDVLDELRLDPPRWRAHCLAAAGRAARRGAARQDAARQDLGDALSAFRQARGLLRHDQLARWMAENGLDEAGLIRLLRTDPDADHPSPPLDALLDELRASGAYAGLRAAARARTALPAPALHGPAVDAALDWYFAQAGSGRPESVEAHAVALGWPDADRLRAAVAGAYRLALAGRTRAAR